MYYEHIKKLVITNTDHKQFFDHCVSNKIIVLSKDCNCRNEVYHVTIAQGGGIVM